MMSDFKGVAVVGAGYWGRNLVRNFHELGALEGIFDSHINTSQELSAKHGGAKVYKTLEETLASPSVRAVAIATPAVTHADVARQALRAGKDVFVEKPLAVSLLDAEEIVSLAQANGRILMVGHLLRYHPAIRKLKSMIAGGLLGKVQYIYSNRLNIGKIRTEENILWSFAPHDISVMLHLLDEEPCDTICQGSAYLNHDVADVTMTHLRFPSGVCGHIFVSWLHPFKEQRLVVVGSQRMAVFDDTAPNKLVLYPHRVEWRNRLPVAVKVDPEPVPLDSVEPLREECSHFIHCVESRATPETDGHEGLRVLRVLDTCQTKMFANNCVSESKTPAEKPRFFVHDTALADPGSNIGDGTKIWHFSHVLKGARIGCNCVLGQNVNVDSGAVIGDNVKIQNNVSVYSGVTIEDDVFLGPSCVLTNVTNPRSQVNRHSLYESTLLRRGCTVGANATIVCGCTLGRYTFVAAGSVVTKDAPDYALLVGNPARRKGWMSRHGHILQNPDGQGVMTCPESGLRYKEISSSNLRCLDLDEDTPLPDSLAKGKGRYDDHKPGTNNA